MSCGLAEFPCASWGGFLCLVLEVTGELPPLGAVLPGRGVRFGGGHLEIRSHWPVPESLHPCSQVSAIDDVLLILCVDVSKGSSAAWVRLPGT